MILFQIPLFKDYLKKNISKVFTLTSTILFSCLGLYYESSKPLFDNYLWKDYYNYILILGITLLLIGFVFEFVNDSNHKKESAELEKMKKELEDTKLDNLLQHNKFNTLKKEYYKLCSDFIRSCFKDSFFKDQTSDLRISLYKKFEDKFYLLGRYSKNPRYSRQGRNTYSDDEGFISIGWEKEFFEIFDIPDFNSNKGRSYIKFVKDICNIESEVLVSMNMKSRSYLVIRINNEDSREPLGIFVFEKLSSSKIFNEVIKESLKENEKSFIHLLKAMKNLQY